ncbi:Lrp/AsnC family transcriptional regulator [Vibrio tritonius]|uniref:Lrp/AsnC family transcriptional regulator n=1 Tax=Vibrio tritonius TaxID=1435069 RepID=UPI000837BBD6|nr:Lrp/AsnC family transcriptional regulator [Vibrio tritonius]
MDKFNERILHELRKDGRLSNVELAERVGLSPSATLRRVQDLERTGVIKGYRAILDRDQLNIGVVAYVSVGLNNHSKQSQLAFLQHIMAVPEIVECHNITGVYEYLLRIEARDLKHFQRIHADVLGECKQVRELNTTVVMDSPKDERQ